MINLRTRAQRQRYAQQTVRLLDRLELFATPRLSRSIHEAYMAVAKDNDPSKKLAALRAVIEQTSYAAIDAFAERWKRESGMSKEEKRAQPKQVEDDPVLIARRKWAAKNAAARIEGIDTTIRARVKTIIKRGVDDPPEVLARKLSADGEMFSRMRARTIARTETHAAAMSTEIEMARRDADDMNAVMTKEWVATNDDRTRPDHDEADGQKTDIDGDFLVGDAKLDHPGDPDGPPEQVINCRCVLVYGVK